MRIGVLTTSFPRHDGDFSGRFVAEHVAWMEHNGHRVDVIAGGPRGGVEVRAGGVTRRVGSDLFGGTGVPDALDSSSRGWAWARAAGFSARFAAAVFPMAKEWDSVIAHWLVPCGVIAGALGIPMTAVCHSADAHLLRKLGAATPAAAWLTSRAHRIVFSSDATLDVFMGGVATARLRRAVLGRAEVRAMGIDLDAFDAVWRERQVRRGREVPRVLFLGRLVPVKGVDVALRAVKEHGGFTLSVAGEGPMSVDVTRAGARVEYLGPVSPERRNELYADIDAVVLPSVVLPDGRTEGMPVTAIEAMAAGVPLLATTAGGLANIPDVCVQRIDAGEPMSIARAVATLAQVGNPQLDLARQYARRHGWDTVGPALVPEIVCAPAKRTTHPDA